jgi:hypothetical protein
MQQQQQLACASCTRHQAVLLQGISVHTHPACCFHHYLLPFTCSCRFKFNTNFFQPDVTYSDGFWSFTGSDKYRQAFWAREALTKPHAVR